MKESRRKEQQVIMSEIFKWRKCQMRQLSKGHFVLEVGRKIVTQDVCTHDRKCCSSVFHDLGIGASTQQIEQ